MYINVVLLKLHILFLNGVKVSQAQAQAQAQILQKSYHVKPTSLNFVMFSG